MEMKLEPIVSSRQITYGFILRAIESRILEVIAETLVLPFWDDLPFTHTEGEKFRGGIWQKDVQPSPSTEIKDEEGADEAEAGSGSNSPKLVAKDERIMSMPVLTDSSNAAKAAAKKSVASLREAAGGNDGSRTPDRSYRQQVPRILRAPSFASTADPMVSPSHAPAESAPMDIQATSKRDSMLKDMSARSLGTSPESEREDLHSLDGERNRANSLVSNLTTSSGNVSRRGTAESETTLVGSITSGKTNESLESKRSINGESKISLAAAAKHFANSDRQDKIASINAAREAAQKWGWGVLARKRQQEAGAGVSTEQENAHDTSQPMGRGHPLPPPGMPLPKPPKPSIFAMPKKRPVPAPPTPKDGSSTQGDSTPNNESPPKAPTPSKAPPLPDRKRRQSHKQDTEGEDDELLVVPAPQESAPASPAPVDSEHHDEFFGHGEAYEVSRQEMSKQALPKYAPPLPSRPASKDENVVATSFDQILGRTGL